MSKKKLRVLNGKGKAEFFLKRYLDVLDSETRSKLTPQAYQELLSLFEGKILVAMELFQYGVEEYRFIEEMKIDEDTVLRLNITWKNAELQKIFHGKTLSGTDYYEFVIRYNQLGYPLKSFGVETNFVLDVFRVLGMDSPRGFVEEFELYVPNVVVNDEGEVLPYEGVQTDVAIVYRFDKDGNCIGQGNMPKQMLDAMNVVK